MKAVVLMALLALAACGVDGPPLQPEAKATTGVAVQVTGQVTVGVSAGG